MDIQRRYIYSDKVKIDLKQISIGTFVGSIFLFLIGFIFYEALGIASEVYTGPGLGFSLRSDFSLFALILFEMIIALILTVIINQRVRVNTFSKGLVYGMRVGLIIGIVAFIDSFLAGGAGNILAISIYAFSNFIRVALAGGAISWTLDCFEEF